MASKASAAKGKRYSPEEKQEVIDHVNQVNAEKGRGGQAAASKKFKISPLTIGSWLKKGAAAGGVKPAGAAGKRARKAVKKVARKAARTIGNKPGGRTSAIEQLAALNKEIKAKRKEIDVLEATFQKLKGTL